MPSARTLEGKNIPYLNFDLTTGRNSAFHIESLTDEQLEELGGTEYRALRWLSYVVPLVSVQLSVLDCWKGLRQIFTPQYFFGTQMLAFLIFGPWLCVTKQYDGVFAAQFRPVNKGW